MYNPDLAPDLLVTVNFTTLNMSSNSLVNARRGAVSILVGLTNDDARVISNTVPTPLFPGSHLLASVSHQIRQTFVAPSLAALGVFAVRNTGIRDSFHLSIRQYLVLKILSNNQSHLSYH